VTLSSTLRSCDQLAYRQHTDCTVRLFPDCPEGKLISIARRAVVTDQMAFERLEAYAWCQARER
jgi:hypothetical protein